MDWIESPPRPGMRQREREKVALQHPIWQVMLQSSEMGSHEEQYSQLAISIVQTILKTSSKYEKRLTNYVREKSVPKFGFFYSIAEARFTAFK